MLTSCRCSPLSITMTCDPIGHHHRCRMSSPMKILKLFFIYFLLFIIFYFYMDKIDNIMINSFIFYTYKNFSLCNCPIIINPGFDRRNLISQEWPFGTEVHQTLGRSFKRLQQTLLLADSSCRIVGIHGSRYCRY